MAMSPETENLFRHLVLLSAINSAPYELHRAIMGNAPEQELQQHLSNHVRDLHSQLQQSAAAGEQSAPAGKPAGKPSTASRAVALLNEASKATPEPPEAASAGPESRAKKVSRYFQK
jgi:hypothetical protein